MKNLQEILKEKLEKFQEAYFEDIKNWSKEEVKRNIARREKYHSMERNDPYYYDEQKFYYNSPSWKFDEAKHEMKALQQAEANLEKAILRVSQECEKHEVALNETTEIKVEYSGQLFDMTIKNGNKGIHVHSIIAAGFIQRPHFRFLTSKIG